MKHLEIFLLDDENVICDIIKREFRKVSELDLTFVEVPTGTGHEAISLLQDRAKAPDIAFIDLRLNNGLSGFDVIDEIQKKFNGSVYNIILTGCWEGSADWDRGIEYLQAGKVKHLIGKWGIGLVIEEIRNIIAQFSKG